MKGALDDCTEFGQQSRSAQAAWQPKDFTIALPVTAPPNVVCYTTRKELTHAYTTVHALENHALDILCTRTLTTCKRVALYNTLT